MDNEERILNLEKGINTIQTQFLQLSQLLNSGENSIGESHQLKQNFDQINNEPCNHQEEIKNLKSFFLNQLSQKTDLNKFNILSEQLQLVVQQIKTFVTKEYISKLQKIKPQEQPQAAINNSDDQASKQVQQNLDAVKSNFFKKNEYTNQQIVILDEKMNQKIELAFLEIYVQEQIDCSNKMTVDFKAESKYNKDAIIQFQKVINRFDYDLLFRASKMDLSEDREMSKQAINQQNKDINAKIASLSENLFQQYTVQMNLYKILKNQALEIQSQNQTYIQEYLRDQANDKIKKFLTDQFQNLKLGGLVQQIDDINHQLLTKAPWNQLDLMKSKKQSKSSAEAMAQHNIMLQKYLKHGLVQVLQFIGLFDCQESENRKKADIRKSYTEVQNIITQLNQLNMHNLAGQALRVRIRSNTNMDDQHLKQDSVEQDQDLIILDSKNNRQDHSSKKGRILNQKITLPMVKLKPLLSYRKYS